jgi:hypothetical protein
MIRKSGKRFSEEIMLNSRAAGELPRQTPFLCAPPALNLPRQHAVKYCLPA